MELCLVFFTEGLIRVFPSPFSLHVMSVPTPGPGWGVCLCCTCSLAAWLSLYLAVLASQSGRLDFPVWPSWLPSLAVLTSQSGRLGFPVWPSWLPSLAVLASQSGRLGFPVWPSWLPSLAVLASQSGRLGFPVWPSWLPSLAVLASTFRSSFPFFSWRQSFHLQPNCRDCYFEFGQALPLTLLPGVAVWLSWLQIFLFSWRE